MADQIDKDTQIKAAAPGKHRVTGATGLYLYKREGRQPTFVLRFQLRGKRREMSLGPYPATSLAAARKAAISAQEEIRAGVDPLEARQEVEVEEPIETAPTFAEAAEEHHRIIQPELRNTGGRWLSPLVQHVIPEIGSIPVDQITDHDMRRIWPRVEAKPDTARKALTRTQMVLDRIADETALDVSRAMMGIRWLRNRLRPVQKAHRAEHHDAIPWEEVPTFYASLAEIDSASARALRFLILTASRTTPVIMARIEEIEGDVWTVPGSHMKATKTRERDFRVPLSPEAIEVALEAAQGRSEGILFPGSDGPMTKDTLRMKMRRMGRAETPHGFRSSFFEWAVAHRKDVALTKLCLSHSLRAIMGEDVTAAYWRGDAIDQRREIMEGWATYVTSA
ncbi:integrase arm-type DNA-binding domain-containing protein [Rhodobacterales bacterium HKCCSP123]|nr:integrase arm-type DNA-binding domain-containing protein [Rhodobacterales bacterium HKCCSP123]